jgi:hypothetical protein
MSNVTLHPFLLATLAAIALSGCVIGRLDSDRLRIIPITEVHRMDDKGFPVNIWHHDNHK